MKKLLFLVLLISAFLTVLLFADDGKTEKKASEDTNRTQNGSAPEQDNELENEESTASGSRKTVLFSDRSPEKMTWNDAVNYCKNLSEKGSGGWHLPNIDELRKGIIGCAKTESGGECRVSEKNGCLSSECKTRKVRAAARGSQKGVFTVPTAMKTISLSGLHQLFPTIRTVRGASFITAQWSAATKKAENFMRDA
ncbi:DUF1566 domain-containing protein [bacterium]|nr:DUF1566 domain-containing protein [bacterium]